jgi:hypothetical protein
MAVIDLSCSTGVQTQQPNRESPQLGVEVSTTNGHSPSADAPWYIVKSCLLSNPHGARLFEDEFVWRRESGCKKFKQQALTALAAVGGVPNGDQKEVLPSTLNISIPGLDSEAVMLALKDVVAISNGSACTSQSYTASHVLSAMKLSEDQVKGALRLSWCHLTPDVDWDEVAGVIRNLQWEEQAMRRIDIEDDIYEFLLSNTREIGENASSILRRLLGLKATGDVSNVQPVPPPLPPANLARPKTTTSLSTFLLSADFAGLRQAVERFLALLSWLYRHDPTKFDALGRTTTTGWSAEALSG